jgi:bile acid:Na+ symporter, BASS family
MDLSQAIPLMLKVSVFLTVLAVGLSASAADVQALFRRPGAIGRAVLSMNVAVPCIAVAIAAFFDPPRAVKVAIIALSLSPVPPGLSAKLLKAGGAHAYVVRLLVAAAIVSIVTVPVSVGIIGKYLRLDLNIPFDTVAVIVLTSILLPSGAGILLRLVAPRVSGAIVEPVSLLAKVLLFFGVAFVVMLAAGRLWSMTGQNSILSLFAIILAGLITGHCLGGPDPNERTVLALASSTRHPGVAMAIATINFPEEDVLAVAFIYLLMGSIVAIPYLLWRRSSGSMSHA